MNKISFESWSLFLEFGLLLFGLGILTRLASKYKFSAVPLFLLLGLFFSNTTDFLFNENSNLIALIAKLGSIILLLLLGIEYSAPQLVNTVKKNPFIGLIDFIYNFLPGFIFAIFFSWGALAGLALGGVTYVSSSGIASQMIRDLKWRKNPENSSVVSILVIEDLIMAPYLPILASLISGVGLITGLLSVGVALLILIIVIFLAVKGHGRSQSFFKKTEDTSGLILIVLGISLVVAAISAKLSFSPEVAAFLVGLLITGEIAEQVRRRLDPIREVLASVFFLYFGLSTELSNLLELLAPAFFLAIITIFTKFLLARYIGKVNSLSKISILRAGVLLGSRGEFSVIIASLVIYSDKLPDNFISFITAYLIITAIIVPIIARFIERFVKN